MDLQLIKCPSCNKPLSTFSSYKAAIPCPRCGSMIKNPEFIPQKATYPDLICPFSTNIKDFEEYFIGSLVNRELVPDDVFEHIVPGSVFKAYIPMFAYEGEYKANMSYEFPITTNELRVSTDWGSIFLPGNTGSSKTVTEQKVTRWIPRNDSTSDNFIICSLANNGSEELPKEFLVLYKRNILFSHLFHNAYQFNPESLTTEDDNLITVPFNGDKEKIWYGIASPKIDSIVKDDLTSKARTMNIRNFYVNVHSHRFDSGKLLLAPFWFMRYTYKGQQYFYILDGLGKKEEHNCPFDSKKSNTIKRLRTWSRVISWQIWRTLIGLGFIGCLYQCENINAWIALGIAAATYIVLWIFIKSYTSLRISYIKKKSKKNRTKAIKRFNLK